MIFNIPGHIEMIRNGTKTQTRRVNRGVYSVGRDYAVQSKRGVKAEADIRIVIDRICKEKRKDTSISASNIKVSVRDARAEGGYQPAEYELVFRMAYPIWDGKECWAYAFHAIEVHK